MKKSLQNILAVVMCFVFGFFSLVPLSQAQITNPVTGSFGEYSADTTSGAQFVGYFVNIWAALTMVGGLAVILFMIWGAFDWITAGGDAGKIGKARDKMTNAVIGLILLVSTFVIIGFVGRLFFGNEFDILKLDIPGVNNTPGGAGPGRTTTTPGSSGPGGAVSGPTVNPGQCVPQANVANFNCLTGQTYTDPSCGFTIGGRRVDGIRCKAVATPNGSCYDPDEAVCFSLSNYDTVKSCAVCNSNVAPAPTGPIIP
jgi:hypothetical protein